MNYIKKAAENYVTFPMILNLELTDVCPLNCPYCYKNLEMTHNIDFSLLYRIIDEFAENGGRHILLSGGEPLLYPYLIEAIKKCSDANLTTAISTSGYGVSETKLKDLFEAGLNSLYISLNSHIPEINELSRDGYELAINAMKLCQMLSLPYKLNTVIRHDNVWHLQELIEFSHSHGADGIDLLSNKPNSNGEISSPLEPGDLYEIIDIINRNEKYLSYQKCFTQLSTYFNKIRGKAKLDSILKGCPAGKYSIAIFSDGFYAPCPHSAEKKNLIRF